MDSVADADGHVQLELGLYVLGALGPAEVLHVEDHLLTCARCQADHDYIAVVPLMLNTLSRKELEELLAASPEQDR